jgi:hypothetical protein
MIAEGSGVLQALQLRGVDVRVQQHAPVRFPPANALRPEL